MPTETEIRTDLTDPREQTPKQRADQAWKELAGQINSRTVRAVISAELAYVKSLREETEPMSEAETLLQEAADFRHRSGKEAALSYFDGQLKDELSTNANMEQVQLFGGVTAFISSLMPQRRW